MRNLIDIISEASRPANLLYHGTSSTFLDAIQKDGVQPTSHWTDRPDVAAFFARGKVEDHGGSFVILEVPYGVFNEGLFEVDWNIIDFSIFDDTEGQWKAWKNSNQDWRACLEVYHAVCYDGYIEPADDMIEMPSSFKPSNGVLPWRDL